MPDSDRWLISEWMATFAEALRKRTGEHPRVDRLEAFGGPVPDDLVWWAYSFSNFDGPAVWIGTANDTFEDAQGDAFDALAKVLGMRVRSAVTCTATRVIGPPDEMPVSAMDVILAGESSVRFYWAADPEFLETLEETPQPAPGASGTFELLLDLELPVSVCFGRVQVPFQEVLQYSTGKIVELNRSIDDPVEIIVNDQVIASGELVVVNGNYGVRIQQIASRRERLRTADPVLARATA